MRFNKIRIPAFGPFTGLEIDLPKNDGDFHLFYGPNEAGKSSLLRSLRGLLFGIPSNTKDVFLHNGPQMRIAAELEKMDGSTRYFQRRKGNKNTLLDERDSALAETDLADFLGGVDEAYFDSMFGLGSDELRRGADALLRGEGSLGEALFSASLGGTPVDKVIESLEAEAARLFKGRAGSSIRGSRKQLDECLKASKESLIKAEDWEAVQNEIEQWTSKRGTLLGEKQELLNRRSWLDRCRDSLPMVGQLRECLRQLSGIPTLPDLGETFGDEIREARRMWMIARGQIDPLENQIESLTVDANGCKLAPFVVAAESEIDRLHSGIGVYREQKQNLATKRIESAQFKSRIEVACRELEITTPIADLESSRISQVKFVEAERKAAALSTADQNFAFGEEKARALQKEIDELKKQRALTDVGDIISIEEAQSRTKGLLEVAKGLDARVAAAASLRLKTEGLETLLSGCPENLELVSTLKVPLKSTIERFREDFEGLKRDEINLEKRRSEEQGKADKVAAEVNRFTRQHELPNLEDLSAARAYREQGWRLVLKDWKGGGTDEEFVVGVPLEKAYPDAVAAADGVADRLRIDAEAVARMEEMRMQAGLAEKALDAIRTEVDKLAEEKVAMESNWAKAWAPCGVAPLSPREMLEWRDNWEAFRRLWDQWSLDTEKIIQDQSAVQIAVSDLQKTLSLQNVSLPDLLAEAGKRIDTYNQSVGADRMLLGQIGIKEADHQAISDTRPELKTELEEARKDWNVCRTELALPGTLPAKDAIDLLRSRREMFVEYDQWRLLTQECEDFETKTSAYDSAVSRIISALKLESRDTENDESTLWKSLKNAEASQNRYDELQRRIKEKEEVLSEARQQLKQARDVFECKLQAALLKDEAELDGFLNHFEEKKTIDDRLRTSRDSLAGFARNESVEDFIARVELENSAELDGSLTVIDERIVELESEIEEIRKELQECTGRRKAMDAASDAAAEQAQLAELASARIQQDGERFVRLQLAIALLKSRIDRFREQNQGPFMEKASDWFAEVTGGAFSGIATTYDEGDRPVIAGQRSGEAANRTVPILGMSEGTRDQLFLALRLAGLELHLADHEPMPLILDDLLVHFDDERAMRSLAALRSFGQRSQVLLFTHHAHVVKLAESQWGKGGFHLHQLSSSNFAKASA